MKLINSSKLGFFPGLIAVFVGYMSLVGGASAAEPPPIEAQPTPVSIRAEIDVLEADIRNKQTRVDELRDMLRNLKTPPESASPTTTAKSQAGSSRNLKTQSRSVSGEREAEPVANQDAAPEIAEAAVDRASSGKGKAANARFNVVYVLRNLAELEELDARLQAAGVSERFRAVDADEDKFRIYVGSYIGPESAIRRQKALKEKLEPPPQIEERL